MFELSVLLFIHLPNLLNVTFPLADFVVSMVSFEM